MKNATLINTPVSPTTIVRTHPMWVNTNVSNVSMPVTGTPATAAADLLSEKESLAADRATD